MDVAPELVERLARQCRLELSPEELREAAEDLGRMLGRMGALDRLDTSGAEPMYRVSPEVNVLRGDEKAPSWAREELLAQAPASDNGTYLVPRTVE